MTKNCLYCQDEIDTSQDDYTKKGKKYVCMFCSEEYFEELNPELKSWAAETDQDDLEQL